MRLGVNALDWITSKIDRKIARAKAKQFPHGTMSECEEQKALILRYWVPEIDEAPHVLVHGDLSTNNIIVDDSSEVKRCEFMLHAMSLTDLHQYH